jgi:hypothetical protein
MLVIRVRIHLGEKDGLRYLWTHDQVGLDTTRLSVYSVAMIMMIGLTTHNRL